MAEVKSWEYLPEELKDEILVHLPLKSLMRFKSVCKSSQSQIKSRSFVDFHRSRHPTTACNQSVVHSTIANLPVEMRELKKPPVDKSTVVVRTMGPINNSIYCVVSSLESNGRVLIPAGKIAIGNPYTHNYKFTNLTCESEFDNYRLSMLATKECRVHYGFGFSDGYKVVVVISWGRRFSSFLSFVYTARNNTWRKIVDYSCSESCPNMYPEITPAFESCANGFYRGRWHWMAVKNGYSYHPQNSVLAFDFRNDTFKSFGAPYYWFSNEMATTHARGAGVFVLNDHLAAIYTSSPSMFIDVWMMMDYENQESWTKIHSIFSLYFGPFSRLRGLLWEARTDEDEDEDDNGGSYVVKNICFTDEGHKLFYYDNRCSIEMNNLPHSEYVFWNTAGVSSYMTTIEPV